uniref:Uncharacterized protein AlNc14C65G4651 n=1 Tax=Albugo laibachii Nc14 TaxID=890382 RepID=F0WDD1_9STRA|nr:conserved hypothetical protein [Albugo laibachii Nc14]|eukprot:CCA19203.1 conserved hypothetical protein [Albugo laibachii Nc14]
MSACVLPNGDENDEKDFWAEYVEIEQLNQYWYSRSTVNKITKEILTQVTREESIGCISTPSIYFALKKEMDRSVAAQDQLFLMDIDCKFASEGSQFVYYDYRFPQNLPQGLHHRLKYLIIDPPFITRDVWEQYRAAIDFLLCPEQGKILLSTIHENQALMWELLRCKPVRFQPSIPHLVYQYTIYTNYHPATLNEDALELKSYNSQGRDAMPL